MLSLNNYLEGYQAYEALAKGVFHLLEVLRGEIQKVTSAGSSGTGKCGMTLNPLSP